MYHLHYCHQCIPPGFHHLVSTYLLSQRWFNVILQMPRGTWRIYQQPRWLFHTTGKDRSIFFMTFHNFHSVVNYMYCPEPWKHNFCILSFLLRFCVSKSPDFTEQLSCSQSSRKNNYCLTSFKLYGTLKNSVNSKKNNGLSVWNIKPLTVRRSWEHGEKQWNIAEFWENLDSMKIKFVCRFRVDEWWTNNVCLY